MYGTNNDSTTKIAAVVQQAVSLRCVTCTGIFRTCSLTGIDKLLNGQSRRLLGPDVCLFDDRSPFLNFGLDVCAEFLGSAWRRHHAFLQQLVGDILLLDDLHDLAVRSEERR